MGLLRGVARTAAIAGTATAVSNGVSRRQGARWAAKEQQQTPTQPQAYDQGGQAASLPEQRATESAPRDDFDEKLERLEKLGQLRTAGVLTEEEFQTQKASILTG
jgi:Short C-terminal domain